MEKFTEGKEHKNIYTLTNMGKEVLKLYFTVIYSELNSKLDSDKSTIKETIKSQYKNKLGWVELHTQVEESMVVDKILRTEPY